MARLEASSNGVFLFTWEGEIVREKTAAVRYALWHGVRISAEARKLLAAEIALVMSELEAQYDL